MLYYLALCSILQFCQMSVSVGAETSEPPGSGTRDLIELQTDEHVGGCQNYGPVLGTVNIRCRIILRTQKRDLILTTTHVPIKDHFVW